MGKEYYDMKRRAMLMLRQLVASRPVSVEEMHQKVALEFGLGQKFVLDFLELHRNAIEEKDGKFTWKA